MSGNLNRFAGQMVHGAQFVGIGAAGGRASSRFQAHSRAAVRRRDRQRRLGRDMRSRSGTGPHTIMKKS